MAMYNIYIRNLFFRRRYGEVQIRLAEAHRLHKILAFRAQHYKLLYETSLMRREPESSITMVRKRDFVFHRLRLRSSRMYMRRWLLFLIRSPEKHLTRFHENWAFQNIPIIVKEYKSFLPDELRYKTYTGHVLLKTETSKENKLRIWRRRYGNMGPRKRRRRRSLGKYLTRRKSKLDQARKAADGGGRFTA